MPVRVLKNRDMEENDVISMAEAIEVVEEGFRELGEGRAEIRPRERIHVEEGGPAGEEDVWYWFNNIMGTVPGYDAMALRIDSSVRELADVDDSSAEGDEKMTYPGDFVGLVLLFDIHSCELKAIMDDHYISPLRVAATSAIAADRLARDDASTLGLVGAGEQARAHVEAMAEVRDLGRVRVYSPTPESREALTAELGEELGLDIEAVGSPRECVEGADLVNLATNATDPVIDGDWLEAGTHLTSIVGGDYFYQRSEVDVRTVERADRIVANSLEQVVQDRQGSLYPPLRDGVISEDDVDELPDLVAGNCPGRTSAEEITFAMNNTGMGIQFAAAASRILENVEGTDVGRELPSELFLTKNEHGYAP